MLGPGHLPTEPQPPTMPPPKPSQVWRWTWKTTSYSSRPLNSEDPCHKHAMGGRGSHQPGQVLRAAHPVATMSASCGVLGAILMVRVWK